MDAQAIPLSPATERLFAAIDRANTDAAKSAIGAGASICKKHPEHGSALQYVNHRIHRARWNIEPPEFQPEIRATIKKLKQIKKHIIARHPSWLGRALRRIGLPLAALAWSLFVACSESLAGLPPYNIAAAKYGNHADAPVRPSEVAVSATTNSDATTASTLSNIENSHIGLAINASQTKTASASTLVKGGQMAGKKKLGDWTLFAGAGAKEKRTTTSHGTSLSQDCGGALRTQNPFFDAALFFNVPITNAKGEATGAMDFYLSPDATLSARTDAKDGFAPKHSVGMDMRVVKPAKKMPQIAPNAGISMQSGKVMQTRFGLRFLRPNQWNAQIGVQHTRNSNGKMVPAIMGGAGVYIR